jgi:hypothetical protein
MKSVVAKYNGLTPNQLEAVEKCLNAVTTVKVEEMTEELTEDDFDAIHWFFTQEDGEYLDTPKNLFVSMIKKMRGGDVVLWTRLGIRITTHSSHLQRINHLDFDDARNHFLKHLIRKNPARV